MRVLRSIRLMLCAAITAGPVVLVAQSPSPPPAAAADGPRELLGPGWGWGGVNRDWSP